MPCTGQPSGQLHADHSTFFTDEAEGFCVPSIVLSVCKRRAVAAASGGDASTVEERGLVGRQTQAVRYAQNRSSYPPQLLCNVALSTEKSMSVMNLLCLVHIARTLKLLLTSCR